MPEIWLNYGDTEVIADIKAENLYTHIQNNSNNVLNTSQIIDKLSLLEMKKPTKLVVLHNTKTTKTILDYLINQCNNHSIKKPYIMPDEEIDASLNLADYENNNNLNIVFINEIEFNGLFGFETTSTRLIKKFGQNKMLSAYEERNSNMPIPGQKTNTLKIANNFTDGFNILSIEIIANSNGIQDIYFGHPSSISLLDDLLLSSARKIIPQNNMIISTGDSYNNSTFSQSLTSLWNCSSGIKKNGIAILLAECNHGLGSNAFRYYIENRFTSDYLKNPNEYIDGMENLLYLNELRKKFNIYITSALPLFYINKLHLRHFNNIAKIVDLINIKSKIIIISDGSHILLK